MGVSTFDLRFTKRFEITELDSGVLLNHSIVLHFEQL